MREHAQRRNHTKMITEETNERTPAIARASAQVAPQKASAEKATKHKTSAPKRAIAAHAGKAKAAASRQQSKTSKKPKPAKATVPRAESKSAKILEMIQRAKGATLSEIMKATRWQAHSVRGFLSTAAKRRDVKIESTKNSAGDRMYRAVK
jgi:hypothetical protein